MDPYAVALLTTAFALPFALSQPVIGPVGDMVGKVRVMIASQSASERQLKNGQTVMQIRTQVTNVKDLGIPDDEDL